MRLREARLMLKLKKCHFAQLEVEHLGHTVSAEGIQDWSKEAHSYAEISNTYECQGTEVIPWFSFILQEIIPPFVRPLHTLTKKDIEYAWTL